MALPAGRQSAEQLEQVVPTVHVDAEGGGEVKGGDVAEAPRDHREALSGAPDSPGLGQCAEVDEMPGARKPSLSVSLSVNLSVNGGGLARKREVSWSALGRNPAEL